MSFNIQIIFTKSSLLYNIELILTVDIFKIFKFKSKMKIKYWKYLIGMRKLWIYSPNYIF